MRKPIIAGNWKMNKTVNEAVELARELKSKIVNPEADVAICVPSINLYPVAKEIEGSGIKLGAQTMHFAEFGAYTGEVSAPMLKDIGAEYVILGHSERRTYFNENNHMVNKRVVTALKHDLKPIICIGETLYEKRQEHTGQVLTTCIRECLENVDDLTNVIVAYEPYWAIGTGKTPTVDQIAIVMSFIRDTIGQLYGAKNIDVVRLLYGGSVTPANAKDIFSILDVDGGLIGGASLKADQFSEIVKSAKKI